MKAIIAMVVLMTGIAAAENAAERSAVYKTQQGDTLALIAKRFGMRAQEVASLNRGTDFNRLRIGQPIRVLPVRKGN